MTGLEFFELKIENPQDHQKTLTACCTAAAALIDLLVTDARYRTSIKRVALSSRSVLLAEAIESWDHPS